MTSNFKKVCILSHPRSGSTSLMKTLETVTNSAAVLEIFHTSEDVIKQHIVEGLGTDSLNELNEYINNTSIKKFAISKPKEYIDFLSKSAQKNKKSSLIFKVFPNHIKSPVVLREVIKFSSVVISLKRNSLHSYISNCKALKVGTFANVDTSKVNVEFSEKDFLRWRGMIENFLSTSIEMVLEEKKQIKTYTYEDIYYSGDVGEALHKIIDSLQLNSVNEFELSTKLRKQDSKAYAHTKVSNPSVLQAFLELNNLKNLDFVANNDDF